ncbi:alpha/beta hydrolase [Sulfitobacter sp.]|uniref:alpha/beta hydrolase n=1 Tax=Sulfitobacter sp. TaxID=1903071 RepID=UPI003002AE92
MPDDVHPQIQAVLDTMAALNLPKIQDGSVAAARALTEGMAAAGRERLPPPPVTQVTNTTTGPGFGHVPVRIYRPNPVALSPVLVFFHGGGFVIGSLESYDTVARSLALKCNATVVSVDYRMAPEHVFPAAGQDCFDAVRWVLANAETLNIDPSKLAVCGDSAGGNLAAVIALMARDADLPIAAQVLVYPTVDVRCETASFARYAKGYGALEADTVAWFMDHYLPDPKTRDDWRASPKNAESHADLPPALIITAECDVLRDDGVAYAELLTAAGTSTEYVEYAGMIHAFFNYLGLADDAEAAHDRVAVFLNSQFS